MVLFVIFVSMIPVFAIILTVFLVQHIMADMKDEDNRTWH